MLKIYKSKGTRVLFLLLILCLTSCAPAGVTEYEYGFFSGVWHSLIFTFAAIGKLLGLNIGLYAITNNGIEYYSGCVIGIFICLGLGSALRG